MVELKNDCLFFRFPEVHPEANCLIEFKRTLRIPDDNREYSLPPGLGSFPLYRVGDYENRAPSRWLESGGVFLPMYQAEAMWIYFHGAYPMALKIAAGMVDAVTGGEWKDELTRDRQDYLVLPDQPWLDGFNVDRSLIRQFVAMPLEEEGTAREQLAGDDSHSGVQIVAYPMKRAEYDKLGYEEIFLDDPSAIEVDAGKTEEEMGLASGGLMRQEIYEDSYGFDVWDRGFSSRCFVHIINSMQFLALTGHEPPASPLDAQTYANAGLPWLEYYDSDQRALQGVKNSAGPETAAVKK